MGHLAGLAQRLGGPVVLLERLATGRATRQMLLDTGHGRRGQLITGVIFIELLDAAASHGRESPFDPNLQPESRPSRIPLVALRG